MRLTTAEIKAIKQAVAYFDKDADVYLYGSRTDDSKRGGDIDLLILSQHIDFETKIELRLKLYDALGEQKIDLLIAQKPYDTFTTIALEQGIKL